MQLPTELQEAHLKKKIHMYCEQVPGHGCGRRSKEVRHGGGGGWSPGSPLEKEAALGMGLKRALGWAGSRQPRWEFLWTFPSANMFCSVAYALHMRIDMGQHVGK